jgi:DNA-binding CsgD family transcriptional regulator
VIARSGSVFVIGAEPLAELVRGLLSSRGVSPIPVVDVGPETPKPLVGVLVQPDPADWDVAGGHAAAGMVLVDDGVDVTQAVGAISRGADAVLSLDASADDLVAAVDVVAAGGTVLEPDHARAVAEAIRGDHSGEPQLTRREQEILELIHAGDSVKQTSASLGIAVKTVENVQSRLFRKLGARNRAQAVAIGYRAGLLQDREPVDP